MKKIAPPGFEPHKVISRNDGWFGTADRIPRAAAEMIARAMPGSDDTVADIKARMQARQNMLTQPRKRQRAITNRMMLVRRA
jgi:hypothetical protein